MINESEAREIVRGFLSSDDFSLIEFDAGWRIIPSAQERGAANLVIERNTAALVRFPSSVPPRRIESKYEEVRPRGHRQDVEP